MATGSEMHRHPWLKMQPLKQPHGFLSSPASPQHSCQWALYNRGWTALTAALLGPLGAAGTCSQLRHPTTSCCPSPRALAIRPGQAAPGRKLLLGHHTRGPLSQNALLQNTCSTPLPQLLAPTPRGASPPVPPETKTPLQPPHTHPPLPFLSFPPRCLHRLLKYVLSCACSQACPTLCDPVDCSPPGSSVRGILQARMLEWVAMPSSRGSSRPRERTQVSCTAGGFFAPEPRAKL